MNCENEIKQERKGMILVIALLIMAVMSIIGATSITTARLDLRATFNTKVSKNAFYAADSGIEISPTIIKKTVVDREVPDSDYLTFSDSLIKELFSYSGADPDDGVMKDPPDYDVKSTLSNTEVLVDIDRKALTPLSGGGTEFGAGHEGTGTATFAMYCNIDSLGYYKLTDQDSPGDNPKTNIDAYYRYVIQ